MAKTATEEKITGKEEIKRYICECDLFYNGIWYPRGEILEFPADVNVDHARIVPVEKSTTHGNINEQGMMMYDPYNDAFANGDVSRAMSEFGFIK